MAWKGCHSFDTVDCVRSRPASLYSQPSHVPALPENQKSCPGFAREAARRTRFAWAAASRRHSLLSTPGIAKQ